MSWWPGLAAGSARADPDAVTGRRGAGEGLRQARPWLLHEPPGAALLDRRGLLDVATARPFVERYRSEHVRAHRELALLAHHPAARVDELGLGQDAELGGAGRRLTRRQVTGDA